MKKSNFIKIVALVIMCIFSYSTFSSSIMYSLNGILEFSKSKGEVKIIEKHKIVMENSLDCGYRYKFTTNDFDSKETFFWSVSELSVNNSYYILSTNPEIEVSRINDLFSQSTEENQNLIKSDFDQCIEYVESQIDTVPPSNIFHIGIIGNVEYIRSESIIYNDTNKVIFENDICDISHFLSSKPIEKHCIVSFFKHRLEGE